MLAVPSSCWNRQNAPLMREITLSIPSTIEETSLQTRPEGVRGPAVHALLVLGLFAAFYAAFFSPIWSVGRLLAPGDGLNQTLSAFVWGFDLWNPYLSSGFPQFADPQVMLWYPPRALFRLLTGDVALAFNLFVISAYVIGASGTYGYVYRLTGQRLAAATSGVIFGTSGFLVSHLGHINMVQAAAWLPLVIWGLEELRRGASARWIAATALAVACGALAGHPQMTVYTLGLAGAYVVAMYYQRDVRRIAWHSLRNSAGAVAAGLLIAGVQLLPLVELGGLSVRSHMDFATYVSYALPLPQAFSLFFPYLFGGSPLPPYSTSYFGHAGFITEMAGYLGWSPWLLVVAALLAGRLRDRLAAFWLVTAGFCLLLVLGDTTPLAWLLFHVPGYNAFRAPTRHFLELSFAMATLSGLAISALGTVGPSLRRTTIFAAVGGWCVAVLVIILLLGSTRASELAAGKGFPGLAFSPLDNASIGLPLLFGSASILAIGLFLARGYGRPIVLSLLTIAVVDISSFGFFCEWRFASEALPDLNPEAASPLLRPGDSWRIAPLAGVYAKAPETRPNVSQLFGTRNAAGYNPLLLKRYQGLLGLNGDGAIPYKALEEGNRALDILGVKRILPLPDPAMRVREGVLWLADSLALTVGSGEKRSLDLPVPSVRANEVHLVSQLGNSVPIPNGTAVAHVTVGFADGSTESLEILAGRDVSEWAYDRPDVTRTAAHARARIFDTFSAGDFLGHDFLAIRPLRKTAPIDHLRVEWTGPDGAGLQVNRVTLFDRATDTSVPIGLHQRPLNLGHWRGIGKVGDTEVLENRGALPAAWLTPETLALPPEAILEALTSSRLPDGKRFDPATLALIENSAAALPTLSEAVAGTSAQTGGRADVLEMRPGFWRIRVDAPGPRFLVVSEQAYPGWTARIDGRPSPLYQTDYVLKGIPVPRGHHEVEVSFAPRSFLFGLGLTLVGWLLLLVLAWVSWATPKSRGQLPSTV